jgi:hypothetical protein
MDLKLDEQLLIAEFRRLDPSGKKELLDYAGILVKKNRTCGDEEPPQASNQCSLDAREEARPEAVKEPIFTE